VLDANTVVLGVYIAGLGIGSVLATRWSSARAFGAIQLTRDSGCTSRSRSSTPYLRAPEKIARLRAIVLAEAALPSVVRSAIVSRAFLTSAASVRADRSTVPDSSHRTVGASSAGGSRASRRALLNDQP